MNAIKNNEMEDIHTISLYVMNKPGVLYRITMVFARRGYNIESLVVSPALDGHYSRITITAKGDPDVLEQIIKQCNKLIDIVHASEHDTKDTIEKEFAFMKVAAPAKTRGDILQLVEHFKAQTVDFSDDSLVIQVTGSTSKLDAMIKMLDKYGLIELVRTGKVIMRRGKDKT